MTAQSQPILVEEEKADHLVLAAFGCYSCTFVVVVGVGVVAAP